jgi:multidrug efflux system membrane fusion protein
MSALKSLVSGTAILVALAGLLPGCSKEKTPGAEAKKGGRPPVPVLVAKAGEADVPVELRILGVVEPVQSSPIRAQITGIVSEVLFREGDLVQETQELFHIDPRTLEATVRQLQSTLARDEAQARNAEAQTLSTEAQVRSAEAQLKNAEAQASRSEELMKKDLIAREQYDQRTTNLDAARAGLDAARAAAQASRAALEAARAAAEATRSAIDNAWLQKNYTVIRSPITGQTGALLVEKGDLVKANDVTLVVVNQLQPILVRFSVPEPRLPEIRRYREAGSLGVRVTPAGEGQQPREGTIVFVDNAVDRATGTIALKARFDNRDRALWPGQFTEVTLVLTTRERAVVVPSAAIQSGQQGPYVFVVDQAGAAAVRPVTPGVAVDGRTVIERGLAAGETVVTDGQLRLTPGATVVPRTSLAGPAPGAPPAGAPAQPAGAAAKGTERPR